MRRKTMTVSSPRRRAVVYTCALIALGVYGVPRLPELHHGLGGTFSVLWILFAGLAVAANLYFLFGADRERSRDLEMYSVQSEDKADSGRLVRGRSV
ncbi:hypothetical protein [Alicyclobacillus sp. ALC3]|uniref:hypothetical protein n=1 Tax=Alicyclobacillus sp. ALC3 TaxID=2796143 RepID=UPI00237859CD|nr:hypothetical protein [Alicyclobacillus sp. ALC3]WDL95590.1 hypothetical protein JC200_14495 [Alicyclobacillus sp. ALC3]